MYRTVAKIHSSHCCSKSRIYEDRSQIVFNAVMFSLYGKEVVGLVIGRIVDSS